MSSRRSSNRTSRKDEGWVLTLALQAAPRLLQALGGDPHRIAREVRLDLAQLDDPEARIPISVAGRFLRDAANAVECPQFGLMVGLEGGFGALGVVGHLARHSPDVRSALRDVSDYLHHQESAGTTTLSVERDMAVLDYVLEGGDITGADELNDAAMGIGMAILRYMCGPAWHPTEVQLTRARPSDIGAFRRVLDARLRFGAERNAIVFPATWLEHKLQRADPGLHRILEEKLDSLDAVQGTDFVARVRAVARAQLLAADAGAAAVARRLAISRRTLHRKLEAGGTTYERLLDETRYAIARQLLANSNSPLLDVAVALGYANPGAFTRAFRRWSGMTPSAWRLKSASEAASRASARSPREKSGRQSAGSSRRTAPRVSSVSR